MNNASGDVSTNYANSNVLARWRSPSFHPFTGASGPGDHSDLMSPFKVSAEETVRFFGTSGERKRILIGWLEYRKDLCAIGITRGYQWLDGSFVEDKERLKNSPPQDLDLVLFFRRPTSQRTNKAFMQLAQANMAIFDRNAVKAKYHLDVFFIDLDGDAQSAVSLATYYLQLFSHQRDTQIWKGMLQVRHDDGKDDTVLLARLIGALSGGQPWSQKLLMILLSRILQMLRVCLAS